MIRAIVHQGSVGKGIEYFAAVAGPDVDRRFFFEQIAAPRGDVIRYFAGGSEIVLNPEGVRFHGNGGLFGEYMFGGHLPVGDLLNDEVVNRLVLFGATVDAKTHELKFTYNNAGFETYDSIFLQGNAVANYVFFLDDRKRYEDTTDRQAQTLRAAGKLLKRSKRVGSGQFIALAHEVLAALDEPDTTLFLLRIINRANQRFSELCHDAYANKRSLDELSATYADDDLGRVEAYQRERIQIGVIYHDPNNQELIDEYKRILASCAGSTISPSARARLMRIRTLSLRNEVPLSIFDTLEEILLQEPRVANEASEEPDYIQSTREILGGFLLGKSITRRLSSLDMVQLMENKQKAGANRDQTFEELLLDTGRQIDEIGLQEEDFERLESFGELVTLFDRIDHTTMLVNKLAFMDDVELTQEQVRSLVGNMQVFEKLRRGLFQQLFIDPVLANEYALSYGKKKLYSLTLGLLSIENNEASITEVAGSIASINRIERAYFAVYKMVRRRMANFYLELNTLEGRETFRREIKAEIGLDENLRELQDVINESLLEEVITKIRLEAFYINQLLPRIVDDQDIRVRTDFLSNSGLDLFQIEELESEYFEMRAFPPELLRAIQRPVGHPEPSEGSMAVPGSSHR
ncbi:MAG: TIGR04442 family protein [Thermoanaerobaculia bacterium]|nr:TIGR04442 family protein [Thermoanaerobaculia bacterium]